MIRIRKGRHIHNHDVLGDQLPPAKRPVHRGRYTSRLSRNACVPAALVAATLLTGLVTAGGSLGRSTTPANQALVKVAYNKKLKTRILVTAKGFTLYLWSLDSAGKPTCYDDSTYHCSEAWPPLRSTETPVAGRGVRASWLKTVTRTDGDPQVTYHGHPLYTDAGSPANGLKPDRKPGDVNGQGFYSWYVVSPAGKPIHKLPRG